MANLDILTIGDSTVDNTFEIDSDQASILCSHRTKEEELCFSYGEKIPIKNISKGFGGSALNTAVGFHKLGLKSSISTIVGDDQDGQSVIDFFTSTGVDTESIIQDGKTNMSVILVYKKERTVLSYHQPRDYSKISLPNCANIYFTSAGKGAEAIYPKLTARATAGSTLYFNPGSWELQNFDFFAPLIKYCKILILNKSEADLCFGNTSTAEQLSKIRKLGAKIAVITDGARGAFLEDESGQHHMGSFAGKVVDPTGAGDSFSAGLVGGLITGLSLEESCKWGMVNSEAVIEKIGANEGLLTRDQISKLSSEATQLGFTNPKEQGE